ncbi:MAG: PQQ-binding-like beta-propeller repeat protein [Phycisphaerae bacterium]|nr:PQQ-binding-like beta-propeller repeat protein [Phycisphaerae bacterium]
MIKAKLWTIALLAALLSPGPVGAAQPETASDILNDSAPAGGLIVQIGCGDPTGAASLRMNDRCLVYSLDADPAKVAKARRTVREAGLSASVWVDHLDGSRLPFAENMVNLLISEDLGEVTMAQVMRVLVPNGLAYVKDKGKWIKTPKPWPAEIDEWTHWMHGPDGNAVAADTVAGPPRRLKWIAGPLWSRSHDSVPGVTSMVSARGRLFYIVDEAPASMSGAAPDKWSLVARDAFNGLELWRIPIGQWGWRTWANQFTVRFTIPTHMPRRLVAVGDRLYVTLGFNAPLTELDAGTGKILRSFEGTQFTDEILYVNGTLIVAINKDRQEPGDKSGASPAPVRKWVAAIDATSGKTRWKTGDYVGLRSKTGPMERISHLSMAAGDGHVFFVDGDRIISLNLADGSESWQVPRPAVPENKMRYDIRITDMCTLVYHDGMVYFAQLDPDREIDWREIRGKAHGLSAATGQELWNRECSSWGWAHPADVFVVDGLVWISGFKDDFYLGLDRKTGEVRRRVSNYRAFDNAHHHRCYSNKATSRYIMTSFRGLEFIDIAGEHTDLNHWVRGTCRLGAFPCNGMVYGTPHPCDCYITSKLNGFVGLLPAGESDVINAASSPRLKKGPAYDRPVSRGQASSSESWPVYRHDRQRSGSTTTTVAAQLEPLWQANLGDELTSPVVADGRVIVALTDARQVVALDRATGRELWRFGAGGRIDTAPTIHKGRAIFGCADGNVYCLRAEDGALIWRFRASPHDRLIGAFGRLESAWPVHGSVLVQGSTVYCTAGRSSFLDGGIYAWALDLETGDVISRERLSSDHDMEIAWGRDQTVDTGVLSDLLVAHGDRIYLRQRPLFAKAKQGQVSEHLRSTAGLLDDSWFHRTRWFLGGVPYAEYLVFNNQGVCGVRARESIGGYGGHFTPGTKGFELFAADLVAPQRRRAAPKAEAKPRVSNRQSGRPRGPSQTPTVSKPSDRWSVRVPVRVTAMVIAGETLFAAGIDDVLYSEDPWAAYEGRKGGRLMAFSVNDGEKLAEYKLSAAPVFDGMAAAHGCIYLSTRGGRLLCYAGE